MYSTVWNQYNMIKCNIGLIFWEFFQLLNKFKKGNCFILFSIPRSFIFLIYSIMLMIIRFSKTRLYNKSIVLFTNDDDPCKDNDDGAHAARKTAEEIFQHKIDLDVVGLGKFDSSKFYKVSFKQR